MKGSQGNRFHIFRGLSADVKKEEIGNNQKKNNKKRRTDKF